MSVFVSHSFMSVIRKQQESMNVRISRYPVSYSIDITKIINNSINFNTVYMSSYCIINFTTNVRHICIAWLEIKPINMKLYETTWENGRR